MLFYYIFIQGLGNRFKGRDLYFRILFSLGFGGLVQGVGYSGSAVTLEDYKNNRNGEWFTLCNNCRHKKLKENQEHIK